MAPGVQQDSFGLWLLGEDGGSSPFPKVSRGHGFSPLDRTSNSEHYESEACDASLY
jgi:hypothetical protein